MNHLTESPIDIRKEIEKLANPSSGAMVIFTGMVRDHHEGKDVIKLEYEAYAQMAEKKILEILDQAKSKWVLHDARCVQRLGLLYPKDIAIAIFTTASHRKEAYAANRFIINEIKQHVPVWKKEFFADGTSSWGKSEMESIS